MNFARADQYFNGLYTGVDGYRVSALAQQRPFLAGRALTYGEITPAGFAAILDDLGPKARGIFYDLGSGTGKAVLLAALLETVRR